MKTACRQWRTATASTTCARKVTVTGWGLRARRSILGGGGTPLEFGHELLPDDLIASAKHS